MIFILSYYFLYRIYAFLSFYTMINTKKVLILPYKYSLV